MSIGESPTNYPAVAWAWLSGRLTELDAGSGPSILEEWRQFRHAHDGQFVRGNSITNWPSDFWIAKSQGFPSIPLFVPKWSIPEEIHHWPTFGMPFGSADARWQLRTTNSDSLDSVLARSDLTKAIASRDAVQRFYDLDQSSTTHADQASISTNQIRAWMNTAFGDLLMGAAFIPPDNPAVSDAVRTRVLLADEVPHSSWYNQWMDYGCDALYNSSMTSEGVLVSNTFGRQGQGVNWQYSWAWLSTPQEAFQLEETVQLVGKLLINEAMLTGLTLVVAHEDKDARLRALCVIRRWLLTTKVLAWIVESLQHPWTMVRPEDLATFAFSAVSPAWPRRAAALSHRSAEAKPVLTTLNMWNSPYVAIDATYVPAWETNTGMIWSLFGPAPLTVRAVSPAYFASEWCCREHEMFQYLLEGTDFLHGRNILDIHPEELPELDRALFSVEVPPNNAARIASFPVHTDEFPPLSLVLLADVPGDLDVALLRAGGALRIINGHVGDPLLANQIARLVTDGVDLDLRAPTNNPDGWAAFGEIFRDLEVAVQRELVIDPTDRVESSPMPTSALSLLLPEDYSERTTARDRGLAGQVADLREGGSRLADALAALEWQASVFTAFSGADYGDKVAVDISGASVEEWVRDPRRSVARGLVNLNGLVPTWILQRAGQNGHTWPGLGEQPIFTRHVDHQFSWFRPVSLQPTWLIHYLANSGLKIGPQLEVAIINAVIRAVGKEALETVEEGDNVGLVVPPPNEFLHVWKDDFPEMYGSET